MRQIVANLAGRRDEPGRSAVRFPKETGAKSGVSLRSWCRNAHIQLAEDVRTQRVAEAGLRTAGALKAVLLELPGRIGADEKTRTFTPIKEQRPQRCASTNSATSASIRLGCGVISRWGCRRKGGIVTHSIQGATGHFSSPAAAKARGFAGRAALMTQGARPDPHGSAPAKAVPPRQLSSLRMAAADPPGHQAARNFAAIAKTPGRTTSRRDRQAEPNGACVTLVHFQAADYV